MFKLKIKYKNQNNLAQQQTSCINYIVRNYRNIGVEIKESYKLL
jgi:hypothetical protein